MSLGLFSFCPISTQIKKNGVRLSHKDQMVLIIKFIMWWNVYRRLYVQEAIVLFPAWIQHKMLVLHQKASHLFKARQETKVKEREQGNKKTAVVKTKSSSFNYREYFQKIANSQMVSVFCLDRRARIQVLDVFGSNHT